MLEPLHCRYCAHTAQRSLVGERCHASVTTTTDAAATTVTTTAAELFAKAHQAIIDDITRQEADIKDVDSAERGDVSNTRCVQSSNMLAAGDQGRLLALVFTAQQLRNATSGDAADAADAGCKQLLLAQRRRANSAAC
jgi:hypothetical protein